MSAYSGKEKRRYSRIPVEFSSEVTLFDRVNMSNSGVPRKSVIRNISAGGLALEIDSPLEKETVDSLCSRELTMYVDIDLPASAHSIRAMAEPAWVDSDGAAPRDKDGVLLGVNFIDIADWDRSRIGRFVEGRV